jgi:hypothetical protein
MERWRNLSTATLKANLQFFLNWPNKCGLHSFLRPYNSEKLMVF